MDTLTIEEPIKTALEKATGGSASVRFFEAGVEFRVELGPRIPALGGFAGGETAGVIHRGKVFPEMLTGVDPLGAMRWLDLLRPLGWFE